MPGKTGGKKESENWNPTDARPFLFLFRIALFLASQPLADYSICRLLSQPVIVCQTARMANLGLYSRLQIGDFHAYSVLTTHYGCCYAAKQKRLSGHFTELLLLSKCWVKFCPVILYLIIVFSHQSDRCSLFTFSCCTIFPPK